MKHTKAEREEMIADLLHRIHSSPVLLSKENRLHLIREQAKVIRFILGNPPDGHPYYKNVERIWRRNDATVTRLAQTFLKCLADEIGFKVPCEALTRNHHRTDGTCATHDHCDANMVMAAAFREAMGREVDLAGGAVDQILWDEAWKLATQSS